MQVILTWVKSDRAADPRGYINCKLCHLLITIKLFHSIVNSLPILIPITKRTHHAAYRG